jgi:hypothetical protein
MKCDDLAPIDISNALRKIYQIDPLVRFMANKPWRAAIIGHVVGFWSLLLSNWLNGSVLWSHPRKYDNTFLSSPLDLLYIGILLPAGLWALAHYYRSINNGMQMLIEEAIIPHRSVEYAIRSWKEHRLIRLLLLIGRYAIPFLSVFFVLNNLPSWIPPGKTAWFMLQDRTPNLLGILLLCLVGIESLIGFGYLIDTVRIAFFHHHFVHEHKDKPAESISIRFCPHHPDGAFGFGSFAPAMNWAGVVGLISIAVVIMFIFCNIAIAELWGGKVAEPVIIANTIICFVFFPWIVFGPMSPFIRFLRRHKFKHLQSIRLQAVQVTSEWYTNKDSTVDIQDEWDTVTKGRVYILEKQSMIIMAGSVLFAQISNIHEVMIFLVRKFLTL